MTRQHRIVRVTGELLVIVVGVLIALWADAGFQTLADRNVERASLVALRADFEASLEHLAEANVQKAHNFSALKSLVEEDLIQLSLDSVAKLVHTGLFSADRFEPRISALRAVEMTGRIRLFPRALQTELSELNRILQRVRDADDDLLGTQQDLVDPFLMGQLSLGQEFADSHGLGVSPRTSSTLDVEVFMSLEGQNVALFKSSIAKIAVPRREELEAQLNLLIGLTDRRLTELGPS